MTRKQQLEIVGTERKRVKAIDEAADKYVAARDARMELTRKEVETKAALLAVMQANELKVYENLEADPPLRVEVTEGEVKLKVKKLDGSGAGEEEKE